MNFEEYFEEKMDEFRSYAIQNGTLKGYEFLRSSLDATVDYGELENYEIVERDVNNTQWQPDAISFNSDFNQLVIIVNIFSDGDLTELGSLTKTEIVNNFKKARNFVGKCADQSPDQIARVNSNLYFIAGKIKDEWNSYKNIKILIVSNKKISKRIDDVKQNSPIGGKELTIAIWDLNRFYHVESSKGEREEIEVDFSQEPLEALRASSTDEMQSYLVMMPAKKLSEIYGRWKSRILEQNVRSYLQNRSKVNKGIMLTLEQAPDRFFAYNNGITTTGEHIEFDESGRFIKKIHNLQIVNGGQTTASIYRSDRANIDLSNVYIQMKLTVINAEKVDELVPNIAKFANSQNPVNAADLFSNHPFHQRIEELSRKLMPPPQANQTGLGKWFYERSRGQYLNEQNDKTPSQKKEFQRNNPKVKLITKTDLALILNSWAEKPFQVSKGAQANFKEFAKTLKPAEDWKQSNAQFNDGYFHRLIAKTIIMRALRKEIPSQDWYEGFPANIVAYTISWLAYSMRLSKVGLNINTVWRSQECPADLLAILILLAEEINEHILAEPGNPTTFAKSERCWTSLLSKLSPMELSDDDGLFIEVSEIEQEKKSEKKEQKKLNRLVTELDLLQIDKTSWGQYLSVYDTL